jgi:hypothetical protein
LPDPRGHLGAAVLEGKIYALGGDHGHDVKQIDVSSCHRFDPRTRKWSAIASLPDGRSHFESSTIIHQGRILIVGGAAIVLSRHETTWGTYSSMIPARIIGSSSARCRRSCWLPRQRSFLGAWLLPAVAWATPVHSRPRRELRRFQPANDQIDGSPLIMSRTRITVPEFPGRSFGDWRGFWIA